MDRAGEHLAVCPIRVENYPLESHYVSAKHVIQGWKLTRRGVSTLRKQERKDEHTKKLIKRLEVGLGHPARAERPAGTK